MRASMDLLQSGERSSFVDFDPVDGSYAVAAPCGGKLSVFICLYDEEIHGLMMRCIRAGEEFALVVALGGDGPLAESAAVVSRSECASVWMNELALVEALGRVSLDAMGRTRKSPYEGEASNPASEFRGSRGGVFEIMGQPMFVCCYRARPKLVCVGAVHIASCLAQMASAAGYATTVVDPRAAFLLPERFPSDATLVHAWPQQAFREIEITAGTAVCILTHDEKIDVPAIECALRTDAGYIGCLAARKRCASALPFCPSAALAQRSCIGCMGPSAFILEAANRVR